MFECHFHYIFAPLWTIHWVSFNIKRKKSEAKNNHLCKQKVAKIKTDE